MHQSAIVILENCVSIYEQQDWSGLIIVGIGANILGNSFLSSRSEEQYWCKRNAHRLSAVLTMPYVVLLYSEFSFYDVELLVSDLISIALLYFVLDGFALLLVLLIWKLYNCVKSEWRRFAKCCENLRVEFNAFRERRRLAKWERDHPTPDPLPRSELLQQNMTLAQQDYEFEARLIQQSAVLDDDEKHVAITQCKQRLLTRISEMIQ